MDNIIRALEQFNLSEKEIKVYLTLVKEGPLSIQNISKKTGINRTFCYEIINQMRKKGILSTLTNTRGATYAATKSENLKLLMEEKKRIVEKAIPEINALKTKTKEIPNIQIFEKTTGLKALMTEMLKEKEIKCIAGKKSMEKLHYYIPGFVKERVKRKIRIKLIMTKDKQVQDWLRTFDHNKELRQVKLMQAEQELQTATYIGKETFATLIFSDKKPMGFLVKNTQTAKGQNLVFDKLWESLE